MPSSFWNLNSKSLYSKLYATDPSYQHYFNQEWNVPQHNDCQLFEMLSLGVFAAGLTFNTAFSRRQAFKQVFHNWKLPQIAHMSETEIQAALKNKAIIRNQRKLQATVHNAKIVCQIRQQSKSFDCYLWHFFQNQQEQLSLKSMADLPVTLSATDRLAQKMKQDGFKFVGPVSVCAFALSVGLIYVRPDKVGLEQNPVHSLTLKEQAKVN